jgi:hypothetical protein
MSFQHLVSSIKKEEEEKVQGKEKKEKENPHQS